MPIDRSALAADTSSTEPSVSWSNEQRTKINDATANAVDSTDGKVNASQVEIDADATTAGDRSLIMRLTATTTRVLQWLNASALFRLTDQAGSTLYSLAIATLILAGTPASNGETGYASNQFQGYRNGSLKNFLMAGDSAALPTGYIGGPPPRYNTAASIILPAGMRVRNSADTADIVVGSNITLSLASSGAAGRDTGSEASNTWYYPYLIRKSSDGTVSAVFSTVNESVSGSITYPSGYDQKRQLPFAIRNDGSSNIIPFIITQWGLRCCVRYTTSPTYYDGSYNVGALNVVNAGTATVFTAVSLASLVPPLSSWAILRCMTSTSGRALIRGNAGNAIISLGSGSTAVDGAEFEMGTDGTQNIEYERQPSASPNIYIDCLGYRTTVDV